MDRFQAKVIFSNRQIIPSENLQIKKVFIILEFLIVLHLKDLPLNRHSEKELLTSKTIFKKQTHRREQADTLYPIVNLTATSANSKVYRKAPRKLYLVRGF